MTAVPVHATGLKRRAAVVAAIVVGCFGSATALGADHGTPGTPGTPGCVGQEKAFFAQLGRNLDGQVGDGVGGLARSAEISTTDLHAAAVANCAVNP